MSYQSTIHLRGKQQPILVSKAAAMEISRIFLDKTVPPDHTISIKNRNMFRKGEIKNIEVLDDITKTNWEKSTNEFYEEERRNREQQLALSPAKRAENLEMFKLLYACATGEDPSEEALRSARSVQERFFISNPRRVLCDPTALKTLIPIVKGKKVTIYTTGAMGFIERCTGRDMQLSNKR